LHDPENGYYVTHSNVGPKVKKGESIAENIGRDKARVRNTIMAADNKGRLQERAGQQDTAQGLLHGD
jgi:predicted transcriptional regulator